MSKKRRRLAGLGLPMVSGFRSMIMSMMPRTERLGFGVYVGSLEQRPCLMHSICKRKLILNVCVFCK